jgi:hypothetical protein
LCGALIAAKTHPTAMSSRFASHGKVAEGDGNAVRYRGPSEGVLLCGRYVGKLDLIGSHARWRTHPHPRQHQRFFRNSKRCGIWTQNHGEILESSPIPTGPGLKVMGNSKQKIS